MAQTIITSSNWTNGDIRITYTASNGSLTITEIEGRSSWASSSWNYDISSISVTVGGTTKTVYVDQVYFGGYDTWVAWKATDTTWTGLGSSPSFSTTISSAGTSFNGAKFSGSLSMSWSTYTISYNANGGSGAPGNQTKTYGSALKISDVIPTRSGYNFLGWGTTSIATTPTYYPNGLYTANASATLHAVWEKANNKSTFGLSKYNINLEESVTVYIKRVSTSNTHTILLTLPTGSYTLATGVGESYTFTLPVREWAGVFTNSNYLEGTITVTTYSGSTTLGSEVAGIALTFPEELGKPEKPIINSITKHSFNASINFKQPVFKYGAIFKEWLVETNIGKFKSAGNSIYLNVDEDTNLTGVARIRVVDNRGFISDPVNVQWHNKKNATIFIDGSWKPCIPYVYKNNKWTEYEIPYVYLEEKYLISSDGYALLDKNNLELKGDDSWEIIH